MFTDSYCVLGKNVQKSLSPEIYKFLFSHYKINASYSHYSIEEKDFKNSMEVLIKIPEIKGINITYPFKKRGMNFCIPFKSAQLAGGVNFLYRAEKKLCGYNTDGAGFIKCIKNRLNKIKKVGILGTGVTGKSIAYALKEKGVDIVFFSRNPENKKNIFEKEGFNILSYSRLNFKNFDLIVNVTPVYFSELKLNKDINYDKIFDINYKEADDLNFNAIDLLINQALINFNIMTDINAEFFFKKIKNNLLSLIRGYSTQRSFQG
ncbi:MAG: shikimate dehydrogenase family protein [Candidatus Muiribacteriota bacterium]